MLMVISFVRIRKFSSRILLKIFTVPLSWYSFPSSIPIILRFCLLLCPSSLKSSNHLEVGFRVWVSSSGVFGIPLFVVMGELGSSVARFYWFLSGTFFCFPLAILLSVIICGLVVNDCFYLLPCTWPVFLVTEGLSMYSVHKDCWLITDSPKQGSCFPESGSSEWVGEHALS